MGLALCGDWLPAGRCAKRTSIRQAAPGFHIFLGREHRMRHWLEATPDELAAFAATAGQPAFRVKQIRDWLHAKRVADFVDMKNLPAALRQAMAEGGRLRALAELERRDAPDGLTSKWLFAAGDAPDAALVESVRIIEKQLSRRTVCVSSMAGCPLGCVFCATGRHGFTRNLDAGEIIEQVYRIDRHARALGDEMGVSHVVFMGMGEPLLNVDAVLRAAATFADPAGMGLSGRHLTISTAGVPEGIARLAGAGVNYRLAVSLHAPSQKIRERIMPAARRWPLSDLFPALETFAALSSRDITFEYCLIDDVNASPADARELAALLRPFRCKVNLIPMNPVPEVDYRPPSASQIRRFQEILETAGLSAPVRMEKGAEIGAACGQLRAERTGKR